MVAKNWNNAHGNVLESEIPDDFGSLDDHRSERRVDAGDQGTQYGYGNDPVLDGGNGTRRGAANVSRQSAPSQYRGALMAKKLERKIENYTLSEALNIIDPSGALHRGQIVQYDLVAGL